MVSSISCFLPSSGGEFCKNLLLEMKGQVLRRERKLYIRLYCEFYMLSLSFSVKLYEAGRPPFPVSSHLMRRLLEYTKDP